MLSFAQPQHISKYELLMTPMIEVSNHVLRWSHQCIPHASYSVSNIRGVVLRAMVRLLLPSVRYWSAGGTAATSTLAEFGSNYLLVVSDADVTHTGSNIPHTGRRIRCGVCSDALPCCEPHRIERVLFMQWKLAERYPRE